MSHPLQRSLPPLLLLLALLVPGGCGERAPVAEPGPANEEAREAPGPEAPPPDEDARVAFAFERLVRGPLPRTQGFRIPSLHPTNLQLAIDDLVAMPEATIRLLSDAGRIRRITGASRGARNPWHGVLDVLRALPDAPYGVIRDWAVPALETNDVPLIRRAVTLLASTGRPETAPVLLDVLEARATDREIAPTAGAALVALGPPWQARALAVLLERGSASAQGHVARWLQDRDGGDDALAWWTLLLERGGPRPTTDLETMIQPPWNVARIVASDEVWPRRPGAIDEALQEGRLLGPVHLREALGTIPVDGGASLRVPLETLRHDGVLAAADARCRLANEGHGPWAMAVLAQREGRDPILQLLSRECRLPRDAGERDAESLFLLEAFLEDAGRGARPDATGVAGALSLLSDEDAQERLAWRLLEEARPAARYGGLLRGAHDLLRRRGQEEAVTEWVARLAESDQAEEVGLARALMRHAPRAAYVPVLLEARDRASEDGERSELEKLLVWVHSRAPDVDETAKAAFAGLLARWIERMPDAGAATLAPALLDLGPAGAHAYADGLRGPRRDAFVQGLIARKSIVEEEVAEALLGGVDATTAPADRHAVWVATYLTAPTESAGALAAARARLSPGLREEVDDILEVIRHRAPRGDGS